MRNSFRKMKNSYKNVTNGLCHIRHLKTITINMKNRLKNKKMLLKKCNSSFNSKRINISRWRRLKKKLRRTGLLRNKHSKSRLNRWKSMNLFKPSKRKIS